MVVEDARHCPECRSELVLGNRNGLATWQCPHDHGVGIDLLEAYRHLQHDELEAIWAGAKDAPLSALPSPVTGRPMVEVTFVADADTVVGNEGVGAQQLTIEVDPDNYFGWFSLEELRAMPVDSGRGPAAPGLVGLDEMDRADDRQHRVFDGLTAADRASVDDEDFGTVNGFFAGIARRLRG